MPSLVGSALFPRKPCSLQRKNAPIAFSMFMLNRTAQGTTLSLLFEAGSWSFLGISATHAVLSSVSTPHTENRCACPRLGVFIVLASFARSGPAANRLSAKLVRKLQAQRRLRIKE